VGGKRYGKDSLGFGGFEGGREGRRERVRRGKRSDGGSARLFSAAR
jgi:hypothetical protein